MDAPYDGVVVSSAVMASHARRLGAYQADFRARLADPLCFRPITTLHFFERIFPQCFPLPISIVRGLFTFWSVLFSYFTDASRTVRHTIFGVFPAFSPTFLALAFQWLALPPTNRSGLSPSSGRKPCTLVTIGFAPFRIRYSASSWYPYAYAKCIAL